MIFLLQLFLNILQNRHKLRLFEELNNLILYQIKKKDLKHNPSYLGFNCISILSDIMTCYNLFTYL